MLLILRSPSLTFAIFSRSYNYLSAREWLRSLIPSVLVRNGIIGLVSSVVSDVTVNSLRVIKTTKQSLGSTHAVGYLEAVRIVLAADGWAGLFGRGLRTRIFANALQSVMFTIVWRSLSERWRKKSTKPEAPSSSTESEMSNNIRKRNTVGAN